MKRKFMKLMSVILLLIITVSPMTMINSVVEAEAIKYKTGDIIEFGFYPQSEVTDYSLITKLNAISTEMISYNYYISGSKSNFMKYGDVIFENEMYRKVIFTQYRPYWNRNPSSYTEQERNGYYTNTVYYFKYEPIKWVVLDGEKGLVLSEMILDSRHFHDFDSYPTWANSNMRSWLNNDFYKWAFSNEEKERIELTDVSTHDYKGIDGGKDTKDYLFLLSYNEVLNTEYGFSSNYTDKDTQRSKMGTDYAKCQGLWQNNNYGDWWLRTAGNNSSSAKIIDWDGAVNIYNNITQAGVTSCGVCPAMVLSGLEHKHLYVDSITTEPTCTQTGIKTFTCSCGDKYTEIIPVTTHTYNSGVITKMPTCTQTGIKTFSCICGASYTESLPVTSHVYNNGIVTKIPTCTETGIKTFTCSCGDKYTEAIPVAAHTAGLWIVTEEPTIDAEGKKVKKCTVCSTILEEAVVPKLSPADFIDVSVENISMSYKSTISLNAEFVKIDGVDYTVEYESSNSDIASIDENGNITATGIGEAEITVTITDEFGNKAEDTCKVTVSYAWWQWLIMILLFGWIWY